MSDVAALLAQIAARTEPTADPAMAVVRLARASIDALVLKLGQSIDAKVTAQLAGGLTELSAGADSFVLKLSTALPAGSAVTVRIAQTPSGQPAITVTPQQPAAAAPLGQPSTSPAPLAVQRSVPAPQPTTAALSTPLPQPTISRSTPAAPPPMPTSAPSPFAGPGAPVPPPQAIASPQPAMAATSASDALPTSSSPVQVAPSSGPTQTAQSTSPTLPAAPTATAVSLTPPVTVPTVPSVPFPSASAPPQVAPSAAHVPPATAVPVALQSPPPTAAASLAQGATPIPIPYQSAPATLLPTAQVQPQTSQPMPSTGPQYQPQSPSQPQQPLALPTTVAAAQPQLSQPAAAPAASAALPAAPGPAAPTLPPAPTNPPLAQVLGDPVQAAARQDSIVPLIARLAALAASPAAVTLSRPLREAIVRVLAGGVHLDRAPPDGETIRDAVLRAGVATAPGKPQPADARTTLLTLRAALATLLGADAAPVAPVTRRPPPPLKGEPARAIEPQAAVPLPEEPVEAARQLLGHTDAALSRLKLLQLASGATDARPAAAIPPAGPELRVEVPLQFAGEIGVLQLLVERDGKHRPNPRDRGWRMRFALNFSATGEVGAEVALLGRAANVSLWAAEPATADALEAALPELAPSLARHGLDVSGIRVRRGTPPRRAAVPGQLLDSAR